VRRLQEPQADERFGAEAGPEPEAGELLAGAHATSMGCLDFLTGEGAPVEIRST
jgi:hypothetical protein